MTKFVRTKTQHNTDKNTRTVTASTKFDKFTHPECQSGVCGIIQQVDKPLFPFTEKGNILYITAGEPK